MSRAGAKSFMLRGCASVPPPSHLSRNPSARILDSSLPLPSTPLHFSCSLLSPHLLQDGVIRFAGPTKFQPGEWFGVVLPTPLGKNDGSVNGVKYFSCKKQHGLFIRRGVSLFELIRSLRRGGGGFGALCWGFGGESGDRSR